LAIVITGATGFVGKHLITKLKDIKIIGRTKPEGISEELFCKMEIDERSDYGEFLSSGDVVIHCAARVHVMDDDFCDPLKEYLKVNLKGTIKLARAASDAGVARFIFVSSIKVNGESTFTGKPFTTNDTRAPEDHYGQSKSEAEVELLELSEETGLDVVIIRPTLVYGAGVKANFASLMGFVSKGLPLPFGSITENRRSFVSVKNLVDLIITCINHPNASNQVFLVSDDEDVSTASMVKQMSNALGKPNRLLPVPLWCYHLVGKVFGKQDVVNRLLGSLQVDISHTKEKLGWTPPQSLKDGFKETAEALLKNKKQNKEKNK
jgi:UDP-glucose 4-epimerase